ncbi:uncharacterized protein LOC135078879 [Ostrinia nubilalis]|uniref:uncharacterized protein LOC135078879 n=1 Tax=Ostrinia nubilalis TaxID=29057 RepID=UPI00308268AA
MDDPVPDPIYSTGEAQLSAELDLHREAFELYLTSIRDNPPHLKKDMEMQFRTTLDQYNDVLAEQNDNVQIIRNYKVALEEFPGNTHFLYSAGEYFLRQQEIHIAHLHFEKAVQIDKNLVRAQKYLNLTKRLLYSRDEYRKEEEIESKESAEQSIQHSFEDPKQDFFLIEKGTKIEDIEDIEVGSYRSNLLVITNRFDAGLLGSELLFTILSAWNRVLTPSARVIPGRAEFYVIGVRCEQIKKKYQISADAKTLLGVQDLFLHTETHSRDPYFNEDIFTYKDLEFVTQEELVFEINFNSFADVNKKIANIFSDNGKLTVTSTGEVNALVGFFKLFITEDIVMTTDPRSEERSDAWKQAVFHDFIPTQYTEGESFIAQFSTFGGRLRFLPDCRKRITRVSKQLTTFLNDDVYINEIIKSAQIATVHLTQMVEIEEVDVVDLCPFPVFGMMMMKRGAQNLICMARDRQDKKFFKKVFRRHNICLSRVEILIYETLSLEPFDGKRFHAVYCDVLDMSGNIDRSLYSLAKLLKHARLQEGGLFMPNVSMKVQLISSEMLDKHNKLTEKAMTAMPPGSRTNTFTESQITYVDPTRLEHKNMSRPVHLTDSCHSMMPGVVSVHVERDGACNGMLCWYVIKVMDGAAEISTKRKSSFVHSSVFYKDQPLEVNRGDYVTAVMCVEDDGGFKIELFSEVM